MTVVSLDMAYCSFREVLAGLDTRLDTPPSIDSHHPDSGLAPLASHILETKATKFDPGKFKDEYETAHGRKENQPCGPSGKGKCIGHGQRAAPGVADQDGAADA